jgi:hypothetical protein
VSTVAASTALVFVTSVLLGSGYETAAGGGAGRLGSCGIEGAVQLEACAAVIEAEAGASTTIARSAASPVVAIASFMVMSDGSPAPNNTHVQVKRKSPEHHLHIRFLVALRVSQPTHRIRCFSELVTDFSRKEHL